MKKHIICKLFLLPLLLIVFGLQSAGAQNITVGGTVIDASTKVPVIGAAVVSLDNQKGTITDVDGKFELSVPKGNKIEVSFIGYDKQVFEAGAKTNLVISLRENATDLDEVVVVGYGMQRKREITGAISSVDGEDLQKMSGSNFADALQGQVAGVNVQASSGAPGATSNIQIRGIGSLSANALGPLYVVDGLPYEGNPNLTSAEIASIEVLKDAASASIYGTRASNGVILITTKRGQEGVMRVDVDSYYGVQNITSGIDLLNTKDYLFTYLMSEELNGDGGWLYHPLLGNPDGINHDTNFMEYLERNNAPIQNHSINLSGGRKGLTYNFTVNYFNQEGVMIQTGYDALSLRSNNTFESGRFSAQVTTGINYNTRDVTPWGLHFSAINLSPMMPPPDFDAAASTAPVENAGAVGSLIGSLKQENTEKSYGFNSNVVLGYKILDDLTFRVNFGGSAGTNRNRTYNPSYLIYDTNGNLSGASNEQSSLQESTNFSLRWASEFTLNYEHTFEGGHSLKALAGYTMEQSFYDSRMQQKKGFANENVTSPSAGTEGDLAAGTNSTSSLVGMLARIMYNCNDRYLLSLSVRRDGSSRFGKNKWATFPSASIGWNPSEENFYKNSGVSKILTDIKFRGSYGTAGNQSIPNYAYDAKIYNQADYVLGSGDQGNVWYGSTQRGFANPEVQWETSISRNIGVDLGFWDGKLTLTADYYHTNKKDMLLPVAMAPSSGAPTEDWQFGNLQLNAGDLYNKGVELSASYRGVIKDFTYSVSGTFTKNNNMVTKTYVPTNYLSGGNPTRQARASENVTYIKEGYPAGSFFLIPNRGTIKTEEQLEEYKVLVPTAQLGDLAMVDTSGDHKINDDDRVYCGTGTPKWESGLNLNLGYKNLDFTVQLYGSYGNMVYNGSKLNAYVWMRHQDLLHAWSPENPTSNIPTPRRELEHNNIRSLQSYYLEDGSYLRVRNIQLGYTLPSDWMKAARIRKARIYIAAQNPFTFTNYTGYDPEVGGDGLFYKGVDEASYPVSAQYRVGVQLGF